ncbi:LLM class F420-dependent oxidoreductase [Ktedonobacter racemifer]|uniref:Putative F420-dependent oxidoreductase n=1 Tax=Ktedonobacter racemifer DSM 44963 TaxID=485913 RepID=D6TGB5_KTERA|nr:LLM class F420-dependent oxidoreductase [Ktedonobacter racemifer]EFH88817.1 putative F420-dependent oxidoreductase [Ktedonobacter racemifer DSM 44963]
MALKVGVIVPQGWRMDLVGIADPVEAYETMTRVAQEAEALGFDSIWLFDHFHTVPIPTQEPTFECWTSTAALARDTKRVRIGQMVSCNSYRNPALLAKMASTVDVLSHGRLDFGIGAGWYEHEYNAYGYPFPDGPTRLRQLRDAVRIIKSMWTDEEAVFEGKFHQVRGAINQPKGAQKPHIPLLIGGGGEKVTLKLVAQYADACNIGHLDNEGVARKFAIIKDHCEEVGRDYNEIRRTVLFNCAIAETDEEALAKSEYYKRNIPSGRLREQALVGTPDAIRKRLVEIEQAGAQELIIFLQDSAQLASLRLFAQECLSKQ